MLACISQLWGQIVDSNGAAATYSYKLVGEFLGMNSHIVLALLHIFIIAPALISVAIFRSQNPDWVFQILFATGLVVLLYHGYKVIWKIASNTSSAWINLIHVLIVAPLLLYIGSKQKFTPRPAFEMLAMTGFAALGYHLYNIITILHLNYDLD